MAKKKKVAAGGLILREKKGRSEILAIQQRSHGGWCFPKGHVEEGETLPETALREVAEETGVEGEIVAELPSTHYTFTTRKGTEVEKSVHWYLMRKVGKVKATHADEVMEMRWVAIKDLPDLLTYKSDRTLLHDSSEIIGQYLTETD